MHALDYHSPAQQQLITQGAACNVLYLFTCETESLTGPEAIRKAITFLYSRKPLPTPTVVHFKVSQQGITLTDNTRQLFFRYVPILFLKESWIFFFRFFFQLENTIQLLIYHIVVLIRTIDDGVCERMEICPLAISEYNWSFTNPRLTLSADQISTSSCPLINSQWTFLHICPISCPSQILDKFSVQKLFLRSRTLKGKIP